MTNGVDDRVGGGATSVTDGGGVKRSVLEESTRTTTRRDAEPSTVDQMSDDSFPASDPPSWSGAISRVAVSVEPPRLDRLAQRVRAEYLEMPGLCLTLEQAQRLWSVDGRTCEALLKSLADARFLRRTERGLFVRCASRV